MTSCLRPPGTDCTIPQTLSLSTTRRIRCAPNGSCLFIALGVGYAACRHRPVPCGYSLSARQTGERIRSLVQAYYHPSLWSLETPVGPRKRILEHELSSSKDLTDRDLSTYVQTVTWGSTPEYLSFAFLSDCSLTVYVPEGDGYTLRDHIHRGPDTIYLVFEQYHYDCLIPSLDLGPRTGIP